MPTFYHGQYSGWTRSKAEALKAARRGTREDGGGVVESILAYEVPRLSLTTLLSALNEDACLWPRQEIATVQHGRVVRISP